MALLIYPGPLDGPHDPSQTSGWAYRPLPALWEGFPTPSNPTGGPTNLAGPLGLPPNLSKISSWASRPLWTFEWASRHHPAHREGHPTPPGPLIVPAGPQVGPPDTSRSLTDHQEGLPDHSLLSRLVCRPLLVLQVCLLIHHRQPGGPPVPSQIFGCASRTLPDLRVALPDLWDGFPITSGPL